MRILLNSAIDAITFGIVAWGIYSLYRLAEESGFADLSTLAFWGQRHVALLAFWSGVVALLFIVYRVAIARTRRQFVGKRVYGEQLTSSDGDMSWDAVTRLPRKSRIDVARSYSPEALKAVRKTLALAIQTGCSEARTPHLFTTLLDAYRIRLAFGRLGLGFSTFQDALVRIVRGAPQGSGTVLSDGVHRAVLLAYIEAHEARQPLVDVTDLFIAAVREDAQLQEMLYEHDVDLAKVENVIHWIRLRHQLQERYRRFSVSARRKPKGTMNRAMTALATPLLDRMAEDLTRQAASFKLEPVVGRDRELSSVFRSIEGGQKSVVLVGHDGVGKSAIVEAIAQRMVEEDVPAILQDKRLVQLDIARIISGASAAEAQERLLAVLYEVARAGNIVLVVPHISGMTGISAGGGESLDLSQVFANELARGYFFAITTATPDEYVQAIEGSTLGGSLVRVDIPEPDADEAIRMLQAKTMIIEYQHKVLFSYDAVHAAVELSARHLHGAFLPEKAIEAAKEAAGAARKARGDNAIVGKEDVASVVSEKANIPLTQLTSDESQKLLGLDDALHARVIGQDQAVRAVGAAMRRAGAAMRSEGRPIANFLFLGPTGVGKTELAKSLAEAYFGDEEAMIRLDMSEYQDPASLYKLIGEPAGRAGGILSEAVRKKPFSLVLLDEIEKADKDVLTVFLQVMDDGRLSDNAGRVIDFTNVILIATSNAGAPYIQDAVRDGTSVEVIREHLVSEQLKEYFRPEFLNRFDDIIVFTPITPEELLQITRLMLQQVESRLEEKGIRFEITDGAVQELADAGYDPAFGARPLRRVLQDRVDNALADIILKGEAQRRDTVVYDVGGAVRVRKAEKL